MVCYLSRSFCNQTVNICTIFPGCTYLPLRLVNMPIPMFSRLKRERESGNSLINRYTACCTLLCNTTSTRSPHVTGGYYGMAATLSQRALSIYSSVVITGSTQEWVDRTQWSLANFPWYRATSPVTFFCWLSSCWWQWGWWSKVRSTPG